MSKTKQALALVDAGTHNPYTAAAAVGIQAPGVYRALAARQARLISDARTCPNCGCSVPATQTCEVQS